LKIDVTAASGDLADAFAAYDRYVAASQGRGDRSLLSPIAKAALRDLRGNEFGEVRASALAALAASGDAAAKKELEQAATSTEAQSAVSVDAALARIGNEAAAARFADRIRQGSLPARMAALEATKQFSSAPPALSRAIVAAIGDKDVPVRAAAAQAAGRLRIKDAVGPLHRALPESGSYLVRLSAAVALHQLGDPAGDELLRQALAGDMAEAKVFAAGAFTAAESQVWRSSVETVLATSTGIDALTAAEVLLALDSEAARKAVDQLASDPNPSIRSRAARVAGAQRTASASTVRRLLEDQSPLVRLYVAEGLLQSERPPTLKR
jgi:HEAT repeat protein